MSAAREEALEKAATELEERLEAAPDAGEFELAKRRKDELEAALVEVMKLKLSQKTHLTQRTVYTRYSW